MKGSSQSLTIIHRPRGIEHPYEQEPVERFPRDPVEGERVVLGVATEPAGAAESVWTTWAVGDGPNETSAGERVGGDGERDVWHVELPPSGCGQRVAYRAHAQGGGQRASTDEFTYVVSGWRAFDELAEHAVQDGSLVLDLVSVDGVLRAQMRVSMPEPSRLHVELLAHGKAEDPGHQQQAIDAGYPVTVTAEPAGRVVATWGEVQLVIRSRPLQIRVVGDDGDPLLESAAPLAFLMRERGEALEVRQAFASPDGEAFWGFGERFNSLDQRGNTLDVRVFDQFKNQGKRTYIPMPFFISSKGYGLHLDTARYVAYDLASTEDGCWSFRAELDGSGSLAYDLFLGEPKSVISSFVARTGQPVVPPAWVFGPWVSANDWNSQAMVNAVVEESARLGIPASVLVIEAWSDEATFYIWNDAQYDARASDQPLAYSDLTLPSEGRWPDPKGMIEGLHRQGTRIILWQIPVLKKLEGPHAQHDLDTAYALERGFCVKEAGGEPYQVRPFWFHGALLPDLTNPQAVEWWMSKREYLLTELGVDGFKTDGGEHIFGAGLRFADGRRGDEIWNLFPNLYVRAYHALARELGREFTTFSRAGFTGAQAIPCHWAGDENSTWEAFRASITAGLTAGISGISFWGWDIGGFSGEIPSAELYLRSAAMATFCPIMQYHSDYNARREPSRDRTPWNIQARTGDDRVVPVYRTYANLRLNLLPYVYSQALLATGKGLPLMRALFVEHPGDEQWREFPYQYTFGDSLLVAPVVEPGAETIRVYLPEGDWCDFWTGRLVSGGRVIDCPAPIDRIPVFATAGAILPINLGSDQQLGSWVGNAADRFDTLCFRVFPGADAKTVWVDHLSGQAHRLRARWDADARTACVAVPDLDRDAVLIFVVENALGLRVDGDDLPYAESYGSWRAAPSCSWTCRQDPGEVLVQIPRGRGPTEVQLLLAD